MTKKEQRWTKLLHLWKEMSEDKAYAETSLWKRVERLASEVGMSPQGVRKFLIKNNMYELVITA